MADEMFMYAVTTGIFVFLVAIMFGARAKRYSSGRKQDSVAAPAEGHS